MDTAIIKAVIDRIQAQESLTCEPLTTLIDAYKVHSPVGCINREYLILNALVSAFEPKNILEIGPGCGASTLSMLLGCSAPIQQVTIHQGSGKAAIPEYLHPRVSTYYGTSDSFFAKNTNDYSFIFVDGDHEEEAVMRDITNCFKWLAPGGIIVAHDIFHEGNFHINSICSNDAIKYAKAYAPIQTGGNGIGIIY